LTNIENKIITVIFGILRLARNETVGERGLNDNNIDKSKYFN